MTLFWWPFHVGLSTVSLLEAQGPWGQIPSGSSVASQWPSQDGSRVTSLSSSPRPTAFSHLSRSQGPGSHLQGTISGVEGLSLHT